jgi:hypothetical protein
MVHLAYFQKFNILHTSKITELLSTMISALLEMPVFQPGQI